MKRWKFKLAGAVVALGGAVGCKQPLYMTEADRSDVIHLGSALMPKNLELDPSASMNVPTGEGSRTPRNVLNPDATARNLSLAEAFSIALENGNEGSQAFNGSTNSQLGSFAGNAFGGDDAIRAFALDPAVFGANIEASLSKFDTRWVSSLTWQKRDDAVTNVFNNLNNGDLGTVNTGLFKPLPTGGLAGVTFNTDYTRLSSPPQQNFQVVNPAYRPSLTFQFEQPLLQNFGVEINQLLQQHPGSLQVAGLRPSGGTRTDGILITRIRYDQSRYEFQRRVNNMIINVEAAYWNLYSAYWQLYSAEQGMRQAYATYELTKALLEAGSRATQELAQVEAQFEDFRVRRVQALQNVLTAERELRNLLGMKLEDGTRLVPSDAPTLSPYQPDWQSSVSEMFSTRPELNLARQELKARQFDVILQKNSTRPDLRFLSSYNVNGIGTKLDGTGSNALESLSDNKFNSWTLGFRLDVPIGFRDAYSAVRTSRLNLARTYVVVKNQERKAEFELGGVYQTLFSTYERIRIQRAQREALARQLDGLVTRVKLGKDPLLVLLDAQRNFAAALAAEHQAIAEYNTAIARFQHSKGTILPYNNITISEGPLPNCVLTRAADHYHAREAAIELRQRPGALLPKPEDPAGVPVVSGPVSLPTILEGSPKPPIELTPPDPAKLPPSAVNPADPFGKYGMSAPSTILPGPPQVPTLPPPSGVGGGGSAGASPNLPDLPLMPSRLK